MQSQSVIKHCLSFDVEEHFQVSAFASPIRRRHWDSFTSRVEANTEAILSLLEDRNVRATFFILGWVAHRHPGLVKKLADKGHEIASHGYSHETITGQTPGLFREDIRRAKQILEDTIGAPVYGYRAPSFTITRDTQWALPVLVEEGYVYDSSIFPIMHDRYGMRGANPWCHQLQTNSGSIWEVPPSTLNIGGVRVPIAGGGYFRLYPFSCLKWMLKRASQQGPLVLYLHPWELDPQQPRMSGSLVSRFRHYVNLGKTAGRLSQLLNDFSFAPIREAIAEIGNACRVAGLICEADNRKELKPIKASLSLLEGVRRG
jgi:polysaccharide deacetylase family protein (PEP-CTERM system associated)